MSTIRLSGTSSGYYDLTVPAAAGTNSIDLSNLPVKDSNGRLGIGTSSPTSKLHIVDGAGANIAIQSTAGSHWRLGDAVGSTNGYFVIYDYTNSGKRFEINNSGHVTTPNQPRFYARNLNFPSSTGGFGDGGTVDINVSSSYNSSNGRFTAPTTGCYMLMMMTQYYDGSTGSYVTCKFYKNGSNMGVESYQGYAQATHAQSYLNTMAELSAGDYVQAWTDFGARDIQNYFQAYLIA